MAVKSRHISMDLGPHCIYLCLKTGLDSSFAFKYKKYTQASKFFKPNRVKMMLSLFHFELYIELRRLIG